jgi:hypothetical protein
MWGSNEAFRIYGLTTNESNTLPFDLVKEIPLNEDRAKMILHKPYNLTVLFEAILDVIEDE